MDINKIKRDFPVLSNQDLIYLDSATSTLIPSCVIEDIKKFYETNCAIVKRGAYKLTIDASDLYKKSRSRVAEFFKVSSREIMFVPNESYGISSLLYSIPWKKDDQIITTMLEHHSNYLPILYLRSHRNIKIEHLSHTTEGMVVSESLADIIKPETKLITLTYSPVLFGTITPIKEITEIAHEKNIPVLVDGTRIVGHLPIDLKALGCDYFVCHGNIGLMGPMGVGVLFINQETEISLDPLIIGSGTVSKVTAYDYNLMDFPDKFEPGNPNVANVIGLESAVQYLQNLNPLNIRKHEQSLIKQMIQGLKNIENIKLYGLTTFGKEIIESIKNNR